MRVLLVQPPSTEISLNQLSPHIGLAYIGAVLLKAGARVEVLDAQAEGFRPRDMRRMEHRIQSAKPDIIGITSATTQIHHSNLIAGIAKRIDPGTAVIIGGYHAGAIPQETLEEFPNFDIAVSGEAEMTMLELVEELDGGGDVSTVRGIAYRTGGGVRLTEPRPQIQDLDSLPFPAFELFPLRNYRPIFTPKERRLQLPASSARGCPYSCNFCYRSQGKTLRERSVGNIIEEVAWDIDRFGAAQIMFVDDTFTVNRKRTMELCDEIVHQGLHEKITWVCESRVDRVDRELLRKMRRAGCTHIAFGVESGNQMVLDQTKKHITLEQARNAVAWAKEAEMKVHTMYILGIPTETRESVLETISFALELDAHTANFAILSPYPGTEVLKMAERGKRGLILETRDWHHYGKHGAGALASKNLSRRELEWLQTQAYLQFYFRWGKVRNISDVIAARSIPRYVWNHLRSSFTGGRKEEHASPQTTPPLLEMHPPEPARNK